MGRHAPFDSASSAAMPRLSPCISIELRSKGRVAMARFLVATGVVCGTFIVGAAHSAPPLHPQFHIVAQYEDDAGPVIRLANGNTYRLSRPPTSRIVIPPVNREPPSRLIDQIERSNPGALPKWFTVPEPTVKPPKKSSALEPAPPAVQTE